MNCPECGRELRAKVYDKGTWTGWYCPWCDEEIEKTEERE